jgi:hypothetical protein
MLLSNLIEEGRISGLWELCLLIEQRKQTRRLQRQFNQLNALQIVFEVDFGPRDLLARVFLSKEEMFEKERKLERRSSLVADLLFDLEDMFVEVQLELLVGVIDTELFERVFLKVLETENVQHSDCGFHVWSEEEYRQ